MKPSGNSKPVNPLRLLAGGVALALFLFAIPGARAGEKWSRLETDYVTLYCDAGCTPQAVNARLNVSPVILARYESGIVRETGGEQVRAKLDAMFQKVQDLLGMPLPGTTVNLKVYSSREGIRAYYRKLYGKEYSNLKGDATILSFYIYKENTIHVFLGDLSVPVLSHEMGHCVVDHYFIVVPPVKVQEILAMYVDKHFSDL